MASSTSSPHYAADLTEPIEPKETPQGLEHIIKPKGLTIVWGKDPRYWRLPNQQQGSAELLQVSWLEVTCSLKLNTKKKCQIGFNISLKSDAFGWNGCPVFIMGKWGKKGKYYWEKVQLPQPGFYENDQYDIPKDFWIDVPQVSSPDDDQMLYFGLYEVWSGKWKGGLQIHHAFVREKAN